MNCTKCGAELDEMTDYCPACLKVQRGPQTLRTERDFAIKEMSRLKVALQFISRSKNLAEAHQAALQAGIYAGADSGLVGGQDWLNWQERAIEALEQAPLQAIKVLSVQFSTLTQERDVWQNRWLEIRQAVYGSHLPCDCGGNPHGPHCAIFDNPEQTHAALLAELIKIKSYLKRVN